jgi:hypothetical protein
MPVTARAIELRRAERRLRAEGWGFLIWVPFRVTRRPCLSGWGTPTKDV